MGEGGHYNPGVDSERLVGITTTIPSEVIYAAGRVPVDLNNVFITDREPCSLVEQAEQAGFPYNLCGWVKGLYAAVRAAGLRSVVAVTAGDCSNSQALMEVLIEEGVEVVPFSYPYDRDRELLALQIYRLMERFGAEPHGVRDWKELLDRIRAKALRVDELTWTEGVVSGLENHYWLVNCSDMNRDPAGYEQALDAFLAEVGGRERLLPAHALRIAYIGVPPIFTDLYQYLQDELGVAVVFNEVQRQFAMPHHSDDIVEQYLLYTYPYDIFWRLADIEYELARRRVDGVIHYTQSFCYHQVEDMIVRRRLHLPILTLEGDKPVPLDARTKLRIESFVEMLTHGRAGRHGREGR